VNDKAAVVGADGAWVAVVDLPEGEQRIHVAAKDAAEHIAEAELSITVRDQGMVAAPPEASSEMLSSDLSKAGTVMGRVTFEGTPPERLKVHITEPVCKPMHPDDNPLLSEDVVVGAGGALKNVVVRITKGLEGKRFPATAAGATIDQLGCQYVPHVLAMMPGTITVQNGDDTLHNVHSQSTLNKAFNKGQSGKGKKDTFSLKRAEVVKLTCDVHGWMNAYVVVCDNPCFAVSGDDGAFSFRAPPGTYTIEAWHEKLGTHTAEITVPEGGTVSQDFAFRYR